MVAGVGHGKSHGIKPPKHGGPDKGKSHGHRHDDKHLPPGLAKKDKLPPGWEKKVEDYAEYLEDERGLDDDEARNVATQQFFGNNAGVNQPAPPQPQTNLLTDPRTLAAINRADSILGATNNGNLGTVPQTGGGLFGGLGGFSGPTGLNAFSNPLLPSVITNQPLRSDPTKIIDTNVIGNLRAGNTAGFIASLAGNVNQSLNSAALNFFQLTA